LNLNQVTGIWGRSPPPSLTRVWVLLPWSSGSDLDKRRSLETTVIWPPEHPTRVVL